MDTIKVDKQQLEKTIATNRNKHVAEYKKAHKKWLKAVVKELEKRIANAKEGKVDLTFRLPEPQSYEKSYDTALDMLKWHLEDDIELDRSEFQQYVLDEWNWTGNFVATSSLYA
jgi:hypothetical protein